MNDEKIVPRFAVLDNAQSSPFFGRDAIAVFARAPICGKVKTRLAQNIGPEKAALLYKAMLRDSLELAQQSAGEKTQILVCYTPADGFDWKHQSASLSNLWSGARHPQCAGDLAARILDCFFHLRNCGAQKILLIGSDAPDIPADYFRAAFEALDYHDLVFGPANDGGFYLIGAREIPAALFANVIWSDRSTLATILANAQQYKWRTALLDSWRDVDEIEDLHALITRLEINPEAAQHTRGVLQSENLQER